jgi:hypothetical protein
MRLYVALSTVAVVTTIVGAASAASSPAGFGTAACLRGSWVANQAETNRVMRALVPVEGMVAKGRLYMLFRDGAFQYGTRYLELTNTIGDVRFIARSRFFTLAGYTARRGSFTTRAGESTIEYGKMTGMKDGKVYTVDGPPSRTTRVPGGMTPFQCRGSTLKVKLPRFASLDWITLQRGSP